MEFINLEDAVKYAIEQRKTSFDNIIINYNNEKTLFYVSTTYDTRFVNNLLLTLNGRDYQFKTQTESEFYEAIIKEIHKK